DRGGGEVRDGLIRRILDLDLDRIRAGRLDPERQDRAVWRVVATIDGAPRGVHPAGVRVAPERGTYREELRGLGASVLRQRRERAHVVDDVEAAAVRRDDEVLVARVHEDVVDGDGGEAAERDPVRAVVEGREEAELGPGVEEVGVGRVLADDLRGAVFGEIA